MKLSTLFIQVIFKTAFYAVHTEYYPFLHNTFNSKGFRSSVYKKVKAAAEGITEGSKAEKLRHKHFRVCTAFNINGDFKTFKVSLVTYVCYIPYFSALYKLYYFINDSFNICGVGYLVNFNTAVFLIISVFCPYFKTSAAAFINGIHFIGVIYKLSAAGKIRPFDVVSYIAVRVGYKGRCGFAYLHKIETAE